MRSGKMLMTAVLLVGIQGCAPSREEIAEELYSEAIEAFSGKKMGHARELLDSIILNYSDMPTAVREARDLQKLVTIYEQERTLHYLDSLQDELEHEIRPLMEQVAIDDKNSPTPVMVHKSQQTYRAMGRCYIRAYVEPNGQFYISSNYTGEHGIHHNSIKVIVGDDYVQTDTVSEEPYNHTFSDGEMVWETVKYKNGLGDNAARLIAENADKKVSVAYVGAKGKYMTVMTETDKEAIRDVWRLGVLLRESAHTKGQIRSTRMLINKTRNM